MIIARNGARVTCLPKLRSKPPGLNQDPAAESFNCLRWLVRLEPFLDRDVPKAALVVGLRLVVALGITASSSASNERRGQVSDVIDPQGKSRVV
jgi:hypothetical protein